MTDVISSDAYVWRCLDGHEFAVSEEVMNTAVIQPRCTLDNGEGAPCCARLACRLRPFPEQLSFPLDRLSGSV